MAFIAQDPESFAEQVVGDGQCVAFVKEASGAPQTSLWREGQKVKGAGISPGTAIATFIDGVYPSHSHGNHAAIYVDQNGQGIVVWDQWTGRPVRQRTIHFRGGESENLSNDGDAFSVIEI